MTVESFSDKLSAYIEGDLAEADRAEMARMVAESPACAAMYENMMLLRERLGDLPEHRPSAEFEFGLRSQILLEAANETRMRHRVKQALFPSPGRSLLSGAVAATLALGVSVLLQGEPDTAVTATAAKPAVVQTVDAPLDPADAVRVYGDTEGRIATVPAQPVDRGALKQLSQEESYALSRRLYRTRSDSPTSRSVSTPQTRTVGQQGQPKPVPVSF